MFRAEQRGKCYQVLKELWHEIRTIITKNLYVELVAYIIYMLRNFSLLMNKGDVPVIKIFIRDTFKLVGLKRNGLFSIFVRNL